MEFFNLKRPRYLIELLKRHGETKIHFSNNHDQQQQTSSFYIEFMLVTIEEIPSHQ